MLRPSGDGPRKLACPKQPRLDSKNLSFSLCAANRHIYNPFTANRGSYVIAFLQRYGCAAADFC